MHHLLFVVFSSVLTPFRVGYPCYQDLPYIGGSLDELFSIFLNAFVTQVSFRCKINEYKQTNIIFSRFYDSSYICVDWKSWDSNPSCTAACKTSKQWTGPLRLQYHSKLGTRWRISTSYWQSKKDNECGQRKCPIYPLIMLPVTNLGPKNKLRSIQNMVRKHQLT